MVILTSQIMGKEWIVDCGRKNGSLQRGKSKWLPILHNIYKQAPTRVKDRNVKNRSVFHKLIEGSILLKMIHLKYDIGEELYGDPYYQEDDQVGLRAN